MCRLRFEKSWKCAAGFTARSSRPPHCTSSHCFTNASASSSSSHVFSIKIFKYKVLHKYQWKRKDRKGDLNLLWCTFITSLTCPYFEIDSWKISWALSLISMTEVKPLLLYLFILFSGRTSLPLFSTKQPDKELPWRTCILNISSLFRGSPKLSYSEKRKNI